MDKIHTITYEPSNRRLKRKRCNECKRRKKRCDGNGPKCDYCQKKNIQCVFDNIHLVHYSEKKPTKKKPELETVQVVEHVDIPKRSSLKESDSKLSDIGIPTVHIPIRKVIQSADRPTVHDDTYMVEALDEKSTIGKEFSLFDFKLSGMRVKQLGSLSSCNIEMDRTNILQLGKTTNRDEILPEIKTKLSLATVLNNTSELSNIESLDDVDLEVNFDSLQNVFFCEKAAISIEDGSKSFVNLPKKISSEFAEDLFKYYCNVCQDVQQTSICVPPKVNFLKVCLPLIFGSALILKCVFLISYYHMINNDSSNILYLEGRGATMHSIHLEVLSELKHRLSYICSVSCDHSLLCVLLLLNLEVIKGGRGALWGKLLKLVQNMISLRGGVEKLSSNVTGLCLLKLLAIHLSTGMSLNSDDKSETPLSLNDFLNIINNRNEVDFYDNFNCFSNFGLSEMKSVVQLFGHITQLHNLVEISYDASRGGNDYLFILDGNYDSVSCSNLEYVIDKSEYLEKSINEVLEKIPDDIPEKYRIQLRFSLLASKLYLYQTVFCQTSISPRSVIVVKDLLSQVEEIFRYLGNLPPKEARNSLVFILPLFLLGVDLFSKEKREWYRGELKKLHMNCGKEMLKTCIYVLDEIWNMNEDGSRYINWKSFCRSHFVFIGLCG